MDYLLDSENQICLICGKSYREHPVDMENLNQNGKPYLHILCNGRRVQLTDVQDTNS